MSTVDKNQADRVIAQKGKFETDPQVVQVIEYDNAWGGQGYGLEYEHTRGRFAPSDYVRNPRVYWAQKTVEGAKS